MTFSIVRAKTACSIPKSNGKPCTTPPKWRITRVDNSTYDLCTRHWHVLEKQMAKRPEAFDPVSVGGLW